MAPCHQRPPSPWHPITKVPCHHGTPSPWHPVTNVPCHQRPPSPWRPVTSHPSPWHPGALHPQELRSGCFWRAVLAEATATLIFVGVVLGASAAPGPLPPALAGGLVAAALACTLGAPQANPALTLALLCTRKLSALRGAAALLAQCTGAVLASAAARSALPDDASLVTRVRAAPGPMPVPGPVPAGAEAVLWPQVSAAGTAGQAWGWETFATFQLALAAFATADRASGPTGLALGSAVAAGALAAGPFSGGSMNPARSLGPAIVTGIWDDHWVYWLGPVLGAVLAGFSYEFVFAPGASREKLGACLGCRDAALVEATSPSPSSPPTAPPRAAPPAEQGQDAA
ncbi:lens fiber major intrinsic protein-like isoform X2 [Oxyura jamaicensis]|uniref:lens fiber major intrinsic protein-like isoform X2 n=1 Tax=Oxyura jamaicensis TaxID=8884 RepID=UPI0015A61C47|nr:lens fiber major intrinsic protein-like isoform X2 [Oxyura jamaicensis]